MERVNNKQGFYIATVDNIPEQMDWEDFTDDEFIEFSDEFMTPIFFQMAFNQCDISTDTQIIRYI